MPRPKSEITRGVTMGVRLSKDQHLTFLRLGSIYWLRRYLNEMKSKVDEEANNEKHIGSDRRVD